MKTITFLISAVMIAACNTGESTESKPAKDTAAATQPTANTTLPAESETAKVSFKVNDTLARTTKGTNNNDRDEHLGLFTEAAKTLSLTLMGDVSERPHRGSLEFSVTNFKFAPGSYSVTKDNYASFRRYETENAGIPTEFSANGYDINKGTSFTLTITGIVPDPNSFNGRDWLASGSFAANMLIKEDNPYKRASTQGLVISNGSFENVRIAGGPKHNSK